MYIILKVFIYCDEIFIEYQTHLKCLWQFVPEHLLYQHIKIPTLFIVISFIDININGYSIDICIWHIIHFIGFWQIQLIVCSKNSIVSFILVNIKSKNMLSLYFTSMHFQFNDILPLSWRRIHVTSISIIRFYRSCSNCKYDLGYKNNYH